MGIELEIKNSTDKIYITFNESLELNKGNNITIYGEVSGTYLISACDNEEIPSVEVAYITYINNKSASRFV